MRVHVVGYPHTEVTREYDWCAYTAKVRRFGGMLRTRGHEAILYSYGDVEGADYDEHVCLGEHEPWDPNNAFNQWMPDDPLWVALNAHAIPEMLKRVEPGDFIGISQGRCYDMIGKTFDKNIKIEWGIGYEGILDYSFHCYESNAQRSYIQGLYNNPIPAAYDVVIPNAFDPADLRYVLNPGKFLLYMGRMIPNKGLSIVHEIAKKHWVITAGPGDARVAGVVQHLPTVLRQEKAELIANAKAVIVPSLYHEPFGGIAVEAQMSGTPVITSDFGAFVETVNHGVSGYRCNILREYLQAVEEVDGLDRRLVHAWAQQYTTEAVSWRYDEWLRRLDTLHQPEGFYSA